MLQKCREADPGIKKIINYLYAKYHKVDFIHPDPLEIVLEYKNPEDCEIAGLIAAAFAIGRVHNILKVVKGILSNFTNLKDDLLSISKDELRNLFTGFKYRFYKEAELIDLLIGIKNCLLHYNSLNNCFLHHYKNSGGLIMGGLDGFVAEIYRDAVSEKQILPLPSNGSACKRLNLYLRWMVRKDNIDPGIWQGISAHKLIIPLDTHMLKVGNILRFTSRKTAGLKTAFEITESLKLYNPEDPVKYDFSLTRPGIHPQLNYKEFEKGED